jgi:hypothetical protein
MMIDVIIKNHAIAIMNVIVTMKKKVVVYLKETVDVKG